MKPLLLLFFIVFVLNILKIKYVSMPTLIIWCETNVFGQTFLPELFCLIMLISYIIWKITWPNPKKITSIKIVDNHNLF